MKRPSSWGQIMAENSILPAENRDAVSAFQLRRSHHHHLARCPETADAAHQADILDGRAGSHEPNGMVTILARYR